LDIQEISTTELETKPTKSEEEEPEQPTSTSSLAEEVVLEEKAGMITQILIPVCITMVIVIFLVKSVTFAGQDTISSAMVYIENSSDDSLTRFWGSLRNAFIFVLMVIVVTIIFVILYKYRCLKLLFGWLILSTGVMLAGFGGYIFYQVLQAFNVPMDYFTFAFIIWNFAVVGNIAIFWHASIKINQGYLICVSVILALIFTRLPEWTTWTILGAIAIYDLFAVLCPKGPLRVLVETAQERDEPIPALIYNASLVMMMGSHSDEEDENKPIKPYRDNENEETDKKKEKSAGHDDDEEHPVPVTKSRGVKLGLGDFVFYSVLVGRAAMFDMLTVFTSFIGIVTGLFCTILLLALWRKALPALPISIFFGILFFFATRFFLLPFVDNLLLAGVVV